VTETDERWSNETGADAPLEPDDADEVVDDGPEAPTTAPPLAPDAFEAAAINIAPEPDAQDYAPEPSDEAVAADHVSLDAQNYAPKAEPPSLDLVREDQKPARNRAPAEEETAPMADSEEEGAGNPAPKPDEEDEDDEAPLATARIAQAQDALAQAQARCQALEAQQGPLDATIAEAYERVLVAFGRQRDASEASRIGLLPRTAPGMLGTLRETPDPLYASLVQATDLAKRRFFEARLAEAECTRALRGAQEQVLACQQGLRQAQHEAQVIEQCPELWQRLQAAIRARHADPMVTGPNRYHFPGESLTAIARHQEAITRIEADIAAALAGVGVA
jgi:hypothetical protein